MTDNTALQADEEVVEEIQAVEPSDENTESAPVNDDDSNNDNEPGEEGGEKAPLFDPAQQVVLDKVIGKHVGAKKTAERRAETAEQELAALKASQPVEQRPAIPDMPDQFAEDFTERLNARDEAIRNAASYDVRQKNQQDREAEQNQRAADEHQKTITGVLTTFTERANTLGVTTDELEKSGGVVASYGMNPDVVAHVFSDDKGPILLKFLAENPVAMDKLNGMTATQAAIHIENVVKPAALKMKKTTSAPPIETTLNGGGSPSKKRGPPGASFE